jgi:histone H3/H4
MAFMVSSALDLDVRPLSRLFRALGDETRTAQEHATVAKALEVLTKAFGTQRALHADHSKLRRSCGPTACSS